VSLDDGFLPGRWFPAGPASSRLRRRTSGRARSRLCRYVRDKVPRIQEAAASPPLGAALLVAYDPKRPEGWISSECASGEIKAACRCSLQ
jgi:hypothetical protein